MFAEAVLVRIAVVFPRRRLPLLLAFPITVKVARAVLTMIFRFCVRWAQLVLGGFSNQFDVLKAFPRWPFQGAYFLELFDNSYVSFFFLWRLRLANQERCIAGIATCDSNREHWVKILLVVIAGFRGTSTGSYASKLFWIAATNFIFPLIFGLIQTITICVQTDIILPVAVGMVNTYVAIISIVFATAAGGTGLAGTAAVGVFMHDWVVPQMGATELRAQCFASNLGSVKLWQKYGFIEEPSLRDVVTVDKAKGGGAEPGMTLIWHLK
ncbi:hypothetical protein FB451DRAFT_1490992 [Mycena latifolia]|nr:hypothetical protein FB451DRAFT_1490992 [Mycena latifolia]